MGNVLKKLKKIVNLYNIAVFVCIVLIIASLVILIKPKIEFPKFNFSSNTDKISIVSSNTKEDESISEEDAKQLAIKQFKKIGEKDIDESKVTILEIEREGEHFYYVCSPENTVEIKIIGGKITRLNSVLVDNI